MWRQVGGMSRPSRIEFEGAIYHVTARGNARAPIVLDDGDRGEFLSVYGEIAGRLGWLCHAYCLMGNHYHRVIETPRTDLQQFGGHSRNRGWSRSGSMMRGLLVSSPG
jgi:REP element-mobilizing transposase RayT